MNIRIDTIDSRKLWDEFLDKYAPNSLFQTWLWGEVIKKNNEKKTPNSLIRLGVYDNSSLVGIAQVEKVTARRGSFFHIRHGPVFASWTKNYLKVLFEYLKNLGKREKIFFIRCSPQKEENEMKLFFKDLKCISSPIHAMDGEYVWILDITKSEEELLMSMRKTTRYLVRKAKNLGVIIKKTNDINIFLELYKKTSKRQGFVGHKGIKEEFEIFARENKAHLYLAEYENQIIAGALILYIGNQAIYHHGASLAKEIPASYYLQWEAIRNAKKAGLNIYNFWGIAKEGNYRHPWKGLTLFKTGFGGISREYIHAQDLPLSFLYLFSYLVEYIRKVKKGY